MDKIEKSTKRRGYTLKEAMNRYVDRSVSDVPKKDKTFLDDKLNKAPRNVHPGQHFLHQAPPENLEPYKMPGTSNQKPKAYKMRGFI